MKTVTAERMREIDERSEKEFGISSFALMENAGRAAAALALKMAEGKEKPIIAVICGRGNNGGDGIACARALRNRGAEPRVFIVSPGEKPYKPDLKKQLTLAESEGLAVHVMEEPTNELPPALENVDLIVDALLGTGSKGKPAGAVMKAIQKIMKAGKPVLALDIPSGIDADTGYHTGVFITASKTITFGLAKEGLLKPHALKNVGELVIADIGHPKTLLES